ncbi:phosphate ABC transporter substrate-binding protein [Aliidongia dinghuensis]|uniref:Phosphate ABC transporter substrate-binding protein n=1 Tax=Aliidongia dinghuensis TaxID=1867774 RepID=A0A8J2YQT1_9PROT|nr:PhnD/SsuA/transferrin family substrate-binding protein [Aliidongia dinghuensis]GGF06359.1 phosphate ABC transporter substrate-binding protein [Aliidongia dinghuensis]
MSGRVAGLPMYDFGHLAAANDVMWQAVAGKLEAAGLRDVPARLDRSLPLDRLWQDRGLLLAQTCGYPLMTSLLGRVRLVATPRYRAFGCDGPRHGSALIVHADDDTSDLAGLLGCRCAANQRHSNTGMNLLRATVADLANGRPFFQSVTWTGSHRASLAMVARGKADLAAIDVVTLAQLRRSEPELTAQVRVLGWTEATPGLPLITSAETDDETIELLRSALFDVASAPAHAALRDDLLLDGFELVPETAYRSILRLEQHAIDLGYPHLC